MPDDFPSRSLDKIVIRVPNGMRERIRIAAEVNGRSMNAEIVKTLEEKYPEIDIIQNNIDVLAAMIAEIKDDPTDIRWKEFTQLSAETIELIKERKEYLAGKMSEVE